MFRDALIWVIVSIDMVDGPLSRRSLDGSDKLNNSRVGIYRTFFVHAAIEGPS